MPVLTNTQSYVTNIRETGRRPSFPYAFPVAKAAHLQVLVTNNTVNPPAVTTLTSSQYSVTGIGNGNSGGVQSYARGRGYLSIVGKRACNRMVDDSSADCALPAGDAA